MRTLLKTLLISIALIAGGETRAWQLDNVRAIEHVPQPEISVQQGRCMTLEQAVDWVRRKHNGRIVSAETRGGVHVIKVLTQDGRVVTERVRAC